MSHFTAFFNEAGSDYWVISGPSAGEPDPSAFYHEPLHKIINPIVESNANLTERLVVLVELAQQQLKGDYNNATHLVCESFVRAIDRVLYGRHNHLKTDELRQIIDDEYRLGHILTFYLLENLPEYEASGKTLKEYYPILISNIDVEREKARWDEYWKNNKDE